MSAFDLPTFLQELRATAWIPAVFSRMVARMPEHAVFSQAHILADGSREWLSENYRQVAEKVWRLAEFLRRNGVKPGDRVAILSGTRPEWMIADLAILYAGATSVSIYQSVNAHETGYILFDAEVRCLFIENQEQLNKLNELRKNPCPIPATEQRPASEARIVIEQVISFEPVEGEISASLLREIVSDSSITNTEPVLIKDNEIASLVYTSGTTGPPKGVIQTHKNHLANLWQAARTGLFAPNGDIFLFLPLAHSFARLIGYIGYLTPTLIKFPAVPDSKSSVLNAPSVMRDLREGSAQVVPMVPRILEKMMNGVLEKAGDGGLGGKLLAVTVQSAQNAFEAKKNGVRMRLSSRVEFFITALLRKKIKSKLFGKGFMHVVSGGAKLPVAVNEFFASLDIAIYEGYGLTETCVATNVNRIGINKIGSVGPCLEEVEVKIASDGEILFRGPNVAKGYYNRPAATQAAWDADGWFHTGDLGELDNEKRLSITGRKKELIVTSGGKKISPLMIEDKFCASPFISSAIVLGDGRQYCVALLVLDTQFVNAWAEKHGIKLNSPVSQTPQLIKQIQSECERVNATLSRHETIKKFRILDIELTVENGYLTPTFKVKKALIEHQFKTEIEALYNGESS